MDHFGFTDFAFCIINVIISSCCCFLGVWSYHIGMKESYQLMLATLISKLHHFMLIGAKKQIEKQDFTRQTWSQAFVEGLYPAVPAELCGVQLKLET